MVKFRWIIFSLFLMLLFGVPAAIRQYISRHGDEVTLPCENVIDGQDECNSTTWTLGNSRNFLTLIDGGQIHKDAKSKSDRLSVTEKCSLVIKKVTAEDAGLYICRQFKSGKLQDSHVRLSLITMTEQKDDDMVTLNCSLSTRGWCGHTVTWLYEGKHVDEDNGDMETSKSECSAAVTFPANYVKQKSEYRELFMCGVTDHFIKNETLFTFSRRFSGDNTAWLWFILVAVGLAALLIIIAVIKRKRTEGSKTQMDKNKADPEYGVSYASISYNKKTNSKTQVCGHDDDDDEGDTVTYSTVKASSSSAGASNDPSDLYSAVNKPNR